jgi:hypothetical protein
LPWWGLTPAGLELVGPVLLDVLVGGEHTGGDGGLAEELGRVLLGPEAQPDGLAGVADRGQPDDVARGGERPDVPDAGRVDQLAIDPVLHGAVRHGHADALGGEQLHLGGQEAGAGPVDDQPEGVPADQQRLQGGVKELGQDPAGRGHPQDRRQVGQGIALTTAVGGQREGADGPGD